MIKVTESGYNTRKYNYNGVKSQIRKNHSQNFTGRVPGVAIPTSSMKSAVEYILPNSAKVLRKLGSNGGEIQNIIINAIGTGMVAPIFIKYNFLSDADEDTRTYSAWRQPVSAVLAILTQAGLTAPFYKIFDNWANNGTFGEMLNKTPFQDEYYIKKIIKSQHPNATKKQINIMVSKEKANQRNTLLRMIRDENTVEFTRKDKSKIKISNNAYRNLVTETIDILAKGDKESLDNINETINKRTARSKYYRARYQEAATTLSELEAKITSSKNIKEISNYLNDKIKSFGKSKESSEMVSILNEVRSRAKVASGSVGAIPFSAIQEALIEKVQKMQEHAKVYKDVPTEAEVEKMVEKLVAEEKSKFQSALNFYESLKQTLDENTTVKDLSHRIANKSKELKIEDSGLNKDFIKEVANQLINRNSKHMKWYKQFVGVFVSLSILPFTCTLLNWIYPRFMDVFFPNLSSKKHNNESAKLVEMAPKKILEETRINNDSFDKKKAEVV